MNTNGMKINACPSAFRGQAKTHGISPKQDVLARSPSWSTPGHPGPQFVESKAVKNVERSRAGGCSLDVALGYPGRAGRGGGGLERYAPRWPSASRGVPGGAHGERETWYSKGGAHIRCSGREARPRASRTSSPVASGKGPAWARAPHAVNLAARARRREGARPVSGLAGTPENLAPRSR